jgi:TonB-linked SusC/RagA family outer membrane protein
MKKNLFICFIIACCYDLYGQSALPQPSSKEREKSERIIEGRITSAQDGLSLAGVNVIVKGTTHGTTTDSEGRFKLDIKEQDVIVCSFIGYANMEITVTTQTYLDIQLEEDIATLSEVVIVSTGYQSLPKERATGSFVQVDNSLVNRRVSTDVISRLEDITSGLIFNRNISGRTNDISIRGQSTLFANTKPLIVIDNFPYDGDLNTINPNDVESMTVLKDAAAASIWGARAGNGVIVITTKKGRDNQAPRVSINSNITISDKPDLFYAPRMSSSDFIDVEKMLFDNGYYTATENSINQAPLTPAVELFIAERDGLIDSDEMQQQLNRLRQQDVRRDFEKYFYRKSVKQQYALNLNGGSATNKYFVSVGWDKNMESLIANDFDRVTFNANNIWSLLDNKLEASAGIYYTESNRTSNNMGSDAVRFTTVSPLYPYAQLKDENGNNLPITKDYRLGFVQDAQTNGLLNWQYNPLDEIALADNTGKLTDYRINAQLNYSIIKGLKAEVLYQYWKSFSQGRNYRSESTYYVRDLINVFTQEGVNGSLTNALPRGGILDMDETNSASHNLRTQLTFSKSWGQHEVNAIGGFEVKELNTTGASFRYYGYNDELATNKIVDYVTFYPKYFNTASVMQIPNFDSQSSLTDRFLSYYANAAYTYKHRYTFSFSTRKDQSNLFGVRANQKGVPLWSTGLAWNINDEPFYQLEWLPYLKLRSTFGYNGNIDKSVTANTTAFMIGFNSLTGLPFARITNPPNPALQWERVKIWNSGIDFELKYRVVNGSIDYFIKQGIDLIGTSPLAPSTGVTTFKGNTANTKGHGIDVVLNTINLDREVKWNTNLLFSHLIEKVTTYKQKATASNYLVSASGSSGQAYPLEGKPLYALYSYAWDGLDPTTGDPQGILEGTPSTDYAAIVQGATPENIVFNGSARPTVFGSLRNTFTWKNLSLSFNMSYRMGYYFRMNSIRYANLLSGQVEHGDYENRWQQAGDESRTIVPSMPTTINANRDNVYLYSEALVEKGDHIRFQDVNLSYTLDQSLWPKFPFQSAQLYMYVNNLGVIWKATDRNVDPDYQNMKPVRSIAFGLKIDF